MQGVASPKKFESNQVKTKPPESASDRRAAIDYWLVGRIIADMSRRNQGSLAEARCQREAHRGLAQIIQTHEPMQIEPKDVLGVMIRDYVILYHNGQYTEAARLLSALSVRELRYFSRMLKTMEILIGIGIPSESPYLTKEGSTE